MAEKFGIPSVAVTAPGFAEQAKATGEYNGIQDTRVAVYPGAFDSQSNAQLTENVNKTVYPQIVELLTKPILASKEGSMALQPRDIVFTGTIDEVNRYFVDKDWSDGMTIIPPTIERVEEFLKFTDLAPDEEIAILPVGNLRTTPWSIAVNGVMAGCRPEHTPILIAFVRAINEPYSFGFGFGSTHSWIPNLWVNGPVARQLGIDSEQGMITEPINAAIGRALGLIIRNLAGFRIKESRMGTFGYTVSWAMAEDEESCLNLGWKPYHVQKGYEINDSTVTATTSTMWGQNNIPAVSEITPEIAMQLLAREMSYKSSFSSGVNTSFRTVLITPPVAEVIASGGYTKESLEEDLVKNARLTTYEYTFSQVYGSFGAKYPSFQEQLKRNLSRKMSEKGKLPPWYPKFPGWEDIETVPYVRAGETAILVCGDRSRNKTQTMAGGPAVTKKIELPSKWDELMQKAGYRPLKEFILEKR